MKDFFKFLYERFLMRDIIGKLTPGFIVFLTFYYSFEDTIFHNILVEQHWKVGIWLIFPISYLIGLILQITGELLGLHWSCKAPKYILFVPTGCIRFFKKYHEEHLNNTRDLSLIDEDNVRILDERHIALKEGTGNFSLALLVLITVGTLTDNLDISKYIIPLIVLCLLGLISHYVFMRRQIAYEIKVLTKLKGE